MKKDKGFTLIELLAVIVILAVIALIAVPQILNILNKSRISAAEDTTYGIVKAGESYVTSFMLTNNGDLPSEDLVFSCSKENGCTLTTPLPEYDTTNLKSLDFKGTKPTNGTVTISDNGKKVSATNLVINGFTCNYKDGKASCSQGGTTQAKIICKQVENTAELHTETCGYINNYCFADGYASGATITYGRAGKDGILTTGDAFDCDVDGDRKYESDERFYYVSDLNNGITTDSNVAVLVYYNNVSGGKPDYSKAYAYDISGNNNNGPVTAIAQLPTTEQWSNVSLTSATRQITSETGEIKTSVGNLPTDFSYDKYAARLLTYQEVEAGCYDGTTSLSATGGLSKKCQFLMENTKYSNSELTVYGGWLESPVSPANYVWYISGYTRIVGGIPAGNTSLSGVRPAIEVQKSNISY